MTGGQQRKRGILRGMEILLGKYDRTQRVRYTSWGRDPNHKRECVMHVLAASIAKEWKVAGYQPFSVYDFVLNSQQ